MSLLKPNVTLDITTRTIIRVIAVIFATYLGWQFLQAVSHVLTLIVFAFFLALALNPAVSWIASRLRSQSRVWATGIAYIAVLTILISFTSFVFPPLIRQTATFISELPQTISDIKTQDSSVGRFVRRYNLDEQIDDVSRDFGQRIPHLRGRLFSTATQVGSALISIITVLVLTFMMLIEGPYWLDKMWSIHPKSRRQRDKEIAARMYKVVTGYVNGQLMIALIGAMFAMVALFIASSIFDAPINPIALAGIVALTGLIPMFGNTLGAAIVVFVSLLTSVPLALTMAVFFLVYQQIENVTIQPMIQAKQNELTPLLVFVAALMGIGFGGLIGGFIAIPLAGCIKILVEDYYNGHPAHGNLSAEAAKAKYKK